MPISYTEIKSYFSLMQELPSSFEVLIIKRLDSIALHKYSEKK